MSSASRSSADTAITAVEFTSVVGTAGTLTPTSAVVGLAGDLVGLAWIQVRMVLTLAALHGHDPKRPDRIAELYTLMGVYGAPQTDAAGKAAAAGALRMPGGSSSAT